MDNFPSEILVAVPEDARPAVAQWWLALAENDRLEISSLWDQRREIYFFAPQSDNAGREDAWEQVPGVVGGRFVPHDDSVRMDEWLDDWVEYVEGHEEVILLPRVVMVFRTFHICQAEPAARRVASSGLLPAGFACPAGAAECPMRRVQAVAPNRTMHLTPAASGGWWVVAPWRGRGR